MKKQGLAQAVQQQARKLWDNYGLHSVARQESPRLQSWVELSD